MIKNEIFDIEQTIGSFFNALYENDESVIIDLFSEDAQMTFPDFKLDVKGNECKKYWKTVCEERAKKQFAAFFIPCNIY
jgi:ketosteroid isomerase-like protein